jgi:A/G-specific adenine glycosylase
MTAAAKLQHIWPAPGPGTVAALLDWYDRERRDLPWRMAPGELADPYRVWLSEIMLQQTTVRTVIPYYQKFLARWPNVGSLAAAELDEVLAAWVGLGYYSRARNLHACARGVIETYGGRFPDTEAGLRDLPGVGPYTAAAIAAIAFGRRATPVDGNIERVIARLFAVAEPVPGAKAELRRLAVSLTPKKRAGDFAQAMMDLGATVCTPRSPSCLVCPIEADCAAHAMAIEASLPARVPKKPRPERFGVAFLVLSEDGRILLRQRPPTGLLASMMEVPSTEWGDARPNSKEVLRRAPMRADWWPVVGTVVHIFTHFRLELTVYRALVRDESIVDLWAEPERCRWVHRRDLDDVALPTVMRKIIAHGMP